MERATRQRAAIQDVLAQAGRPLAPAEVLSAARRRVPGIGIATVYRTLRVMVEADIVEPVMLPGESARFELKHTTGHHHHFRCLECDQVYEVPGCPGNLARFAPPGFTVEAHDLVLIGRCASCAA